jgi:hypothetical protein
MPSRRAYYRATALLPALAIVAYVVVGVFGHSLHGLLPCSDAACGTAPAAEQHCCCCHHESALRTVATPALEGAEFRSAGHDASKCSLCTLLAKIKVGRLAFYHADFSVEHSHHELVVADELLAADLILSGAPRGPPLA